MGEWQIRITNKWRWTWRVRTHAVGEARHDTMVPSILVFFRNFCGSFSCSHWKMKLLTLSVLYQVCFLIHVTGVLPPLCTGVQTALHIVQCRLHPRTPWFIGCTANPRKSHGFWMFLGRDVLGVQSTQGPQSNRWHQQVLQRFHGGSFRKGGHISLCTIPFCCPCKGKMKAGGHFIAKLIHILLSTVYFGETRCSKRKDNSTKV